jgi:molecular chaperone GrpE (heat shock protein)
MPRMPQPIPERMPTDPSSYYNPTIFGQQMGDMDFSQMPEISPVDMSNLQMPTLPREISQMDLPQMPEGLPSMQDVQRMPQMSMNDMQPRMMMQAGDEVSPEQEIFSLQAQLKNLEEQLRLDRSYNDDQAVINTSAEMAAIQKRIQEIMNGMPELAGGGDFPDLTGDGKITQADILKGRGVYAEGDEVMMMEETEMMAPGGDEIEASLMEVQGMQPETQALDQYVQMVMQMVQAGASEAEVIESLRQAGLDDDDISAVFQAVMETLQGSMEQGGIDAELAQLS